MKKQTRGMMISTLRKGIGIAMGIAVADLVA